MPILNQSNDVMILIALIVFAILINVYIVFRYRKLLSEVNSEKLKCRKIMHDMRTPAASIQSGVNGIKIYFSKLIEAYSLADNNELITDKINPVQFKALSEAIEYINLASVKLNTYIDQLSGNLKEK
jgi:hypothetical protein